MQAIFSVRRRWLLLTMTVATSARRSSDSRTAFDSSLCTSSRWDACSKKTIAALGEKRYRNLPKDLTAYERRVALSEIREESADKFRITVAELNRIRKANKLTY